MADKILSTSNFNSNTKQNTTRNLLVFGLFAILHCTPKVQWIRSLPETFIRDTNLPKGLYLRPTEKKSPIGSKTYSLDWKEEIQIFSNGTFEKTWVEWKKTESKSSAKQAIGFGIWVKSGAWVLLKTEMKEFSECDLDKKNKTPKGKDWKKILPCPRSEKQNFSHKLVYHFERMSLVPMQYESGYVESNFGVAWETDIAYTESKLFGIARLKFSKKEFQPHVYYHVKLD
ncbi:hypothetical protein P3G55_00300 [Leptospira sp. 96542]|nr:hypothetical protein [Leptospira sp. 96542]